MTISTRAASRPELESNGSRPECGAAAPAVVSSYLVTFHPVALPGSSRMSCR